MESVYRINDVRLWIETFGSENNPAIILIAGAMAPGTFWDVEFCQHISSNEFFVIRFDNRDIGYSSHFPSCKPNTSIRMSYTIMDMVNDVDGILKYFQLEQAVVIGHSLGGTIAQLYTITHPEKVISPFIVSSPIIAKGNIVYEKIDEKKTSKMWEILMSNKMYPDVGRGMLEYRKIWKYLNGGYELDEEMADNYTRRLYETEIIEPAWNHTKVQENIPDIYDMLNKFPKRIHFIYGEEDYLASSLNNTKKLTNSLDNADLLVIPRANHMFFNKSIWKLLYKYILEQIHKEIKIA